jgi:hypothetical protein
MSISNGKLSKKLNCYDFYNENISATPQNTQTKQHDSLKGKEFLECGHDSIYP